MFYVAPLFLIALLVWVERGAPRPRRRARGRRRGSPPCCRALLPFADADRRQRRLRHVRAPAVVDGARVGDPARPALAGRARRLRAPRRSRSRSCRRRAAIVLPRARARVLRRHDAAGRRTHARGLDRRALPGDHARPTATGSTASTRRRGGGDLDGEAADARRDLRERVLQPQRRARLPHGRRDRARRSRAGAAAHRTAHGPPARLVGTSGARAVRARRRLAAAARTRASRATRRRASRSSRRAGRSALTHGRRPAMRTTAGRGRVVGYTRYGCDGGSVPSTLSSDPTLFRTRRRSLRARSGGRSRSASRSRAPAKATGCASRSCPARARQAAWSRSTVSPTAVPGKRRRPPAGHRTSGRSSTGREDRLGRVAAVARADRGRQVPPRSLAAVVEAAAGGTRSSPSRRRARRGAARSRGRSRAIAVETKLVRPPVRAPLAHGLEPPRPAGARALRRPFRRLPLHRLDVPAAARRRALDDDPRPRAAALPRVDDAAHASRCTARSTATRRARAT